MLPIPLIPGNLMSVIKATSSAVPKLHHWLHDEITNFTGGRLLGR